MLGLRTRRGKILLSIFLSLAVCICLVLRKRSESKVDRAFAACKAESGKLTEAEILPLLQDMWEGMKQRPLPVRLLPERAAAFLVPPSHTGARLIRERTRIVDSLVAAIQDPNVHPLAQQMAWQLLRHFDDPRTLECAFAMVEQGTVPPGGFEFTLPALLPTCPPASGWSNKALAELRDAFVADSFEALCLDLLEDHMQRQDLLPWDITVLHWLNRCYGMDFDSWLSEQCPEALELRTRELAKGYDLVTALHGIRLGIFVGIADDDIDVLWEHPQDRTGARFLLERCGPASGTVCVSGQYWHSDLLKWFRENRERLRYDWDLHRFVVKDD